MWTSMSIFITDVIYLITQLFLPDLKCRANRNKSFLHLRWEKNISQMSPLKIKNKLCAIKKVHISIQTFPTFLHLNNKFKHFLKINASFSSYKQYKVHFTPLCFFLQIMTLTSLLWGLLHAWPRVSYKKLSWAALSAPPRWHHIQWHVR